MSIPASVSLTNQVNLTGNVNLSTPGSVTDWLSVACFAAAAVLLVITSIGLLRFSDVLARIHAATKPQMFGLLLVAAGTVLHFKSWAVAGMLLLAVAVQVLTAPVAAHFIARSAYRTGMVNKDLLVEDQLSRRAEEDVEEGDA